MSRVWFSTESSQITNLSAQMPPPTNRLTRLIVCDGDWDVPFHMTVGQWMLLLATESSSSKLLRCLFIFAFRLRMRWGRATTEFCSSAGWVALSCGNRLSQCWENLWALASGVWPFLGGEGDLSDTWDWAALCIFFQLAQKVHFSLWKAFCSGNKLF